jgi:hypothetical protein
VLITVDELDPAGIVVKTIIQTDFVSSAKQTVVDFSGICQICHIEGGRVARHDYEWCKENNRLDEYHERTVGDSQVEVTILSMANGDVLIVKGQPQLMLVESN